MYCEKVEQPIIINRLVNTNIMENESTVTARWMPCSVIFDKASLLAAKLY